MNEELRQRLEALRESWASTADIQEKRAEETRGNREVANGHYNYALALEACVEQLHQAMESASPSAGNAAQTAVRSTAWLGRWWNTSKAGRPNGRLVAGLIAELPLPFASAYFRCATIKPHPNRRVKRPNDGDQV